jgi:hypothetical protein
VVRLPRVHHRPTAAAVPGARLACAAQSGLRSGPSFHNRSIAMVDRSEIREHMEVIGADGGHIGTVDEIEGERIKLTKSDRGSGGEHHYLSITLVEEVDANAVRMSFIAELAPQFWESANSSS